MRPKSILLSAATAFLAFAVDPVAELEGVTDWVHLLPKGKAVLIDGRKDVIIYDGGDVPMMGYSGRPGETRIPIDVNHANAKRGHEGEATPAVGWIVELSARDDGLWGLAEWNEEGKKLLSQKAYRGISPEIFTDPKTGKVAGISGASLTNRPALGGLTPLFFSQSEPTGDTMNLALLLAALSLAATTTEAEALAAVKALKEADALKATQLAALAEAVGVAKDTEHSAVLLAAQKLKTPEGMVPATAVAALQEELKTLTAQHNELQGGISKRNAEAFVDGAIKEGRVGVTALREHYIARHMLSAEEAAKVEKEIAALPKLGGNNTILPPTPAKDGEVRLTDADLFVAKMMGTNIDQLKKVEAAAQSAA